jgi:thiol peroxidase
MTLARTLALVLIVTGGTLTGCDGRHSTEPPTPSQPIGFQVDQPLTTQPARGIEVTGPPADVTRNGMPMTLVGDSLAEGDPAPDATVLGTGMKPISISDYRGRILVISAVPSLDTEVCNAQTLAIESLAYRADPTHRDVAFLTVSMDLPFALARWAHEHGTTHQKLASDYQDREFGRRFGLLIEELQLLARAVLVIDRKGTIRTIYVVDDLLHSPDLSVIAADIQRLRSPEQDADGEQDGQSP